MEVVINFLRIFLISFIFAQLSSACSSTLNEENNSQPPPSSVQTETGNLFFIGQDLGAIRGYYNSECCVQADGTTTYISLYNILSAEADYGGIGIDASGNPLTKETTWGSGPMNAYKNATEFGNHDLAIGLFIAENDHPGAMAKLVKGNYDGEIRQIAKLADYVSGDVYLRIGYEFEGLWNKGHENTDLYKAAWKRIVNTLRNEDADNIIYVWQTAAGTIDDAIEKRHEDISDWYPGDEYVDWMALSWFMNPDEKQTVPSDYKSPTTRELADELIAFARVKRKPVMIAEAAPQAFDLDEKETRFHSPVWDGEAGTNITPISSEEIWDYWYAPLFKYMNTNSDVIKSLAYINVDWDSQPMWGTPWEGGFWGDSRIENDEYITQQWNKAIIEWQKQGLKP